MPPETMTLLWELFLIAVMLFVLAKWRTMTNETGMATRQFMFFTLIATWMFGLVTVLVFVCIPLRRVNQAVYLAVQTAGFVATIVTVVPCIDFVAKRVYYFAGEGPPLAQDELRTMITQINRLDAPIQVDERNEKLVVTWRYAQVKWWELLMRAAPEYLYELHVKLNDTKHEAVLIDVFRCVSWNAGPNEVEVRGRNPFLSLTGQLGSEWGISETFELHNPDDYEFRAEEIKSAIMNSILRSGWAVRFGLW
jgi:hypothetical protein